MSSLKTRETGISAESPLIRAQQGRFSVGWCGGSKPSATVYEWEGGPGFVELEVYTVWVLFYLECPLKAEPEVNTWVWRFFAEIVPGGRNGRLRS